MFDLYKDASETIHYGSYGALISDDVEFICSEGELNFWHPYHLVFMKCTLAELDECRHRRKTMSIRSIIRVVDIL